MSGEVLMLRVRKTSRVAYVVSTLIGLAAVTAATGCGVSPEENGPEKIPPVRDAAGGAQIDPTAPSPTVPPADVSATANPEQPAPNDDAENSEGAYPRSVPLEQLADLCRAPDVPTAGRSRGHEKRYSEIDGIFELYAEEYIEIDLTAGDDMHLVIRDNEGLTLDESFIVDDIEYTLDGEDEWQASTVGEWWGNVTNQNAGPGGNSESPVGPGGESEGPVGPVGTVDDSPAPSGLICGLPFDWFTGATDYGMEELGGITVRHVALLAGPSSYEYWVSPQGRKVQSLHTRVITRGYSSADGQPVREKAVTLWTFTRDGPDVIVAPQVPVPGQ